MLLQMSQRDEKGTWCWLQSRTGEKIGMHFHPRGNACRPAVTDAHPRVMGPVRVLHARARLRKSRRAAAHKFHVK